MHEGGSHYPAGPLNGHHRAFFTNSSSNQTMSRNGYQINDQDSGGGGIRKSVPMKQQFQMIRPTGSTSP